MSPSGGPGHAITETAFDVIHGYGGVAIGEHLGQLLTALFVAIIAAMQASEGARFTSLVGWSTAIAIATGTMEGFSISLGTPIAAFSIATVLGFLGLTIWLLVTGVDLWRRAAA